MISGTSTFTDPDAYQAVIGAASLGGSSANFIVTGGGDFKARLTWLNLRHLRVVRGSENLPRIAYISLPPDRVIFSFPTSAAPAIWNGFGLQFGDILFRGRGERTHQWTAGPSQWGLISLPPEQLAASYRALTGSEITLPPRGRVLRPPRSTTARLLRLHAKVCRFAETRYELTGHPEVGRAMEQELLHALVNCLMVDDANSNLETMRHHTEIMVRFESALTMHLGHQLNMPEICADIGVTERTLRMCCIEMLGMSPTRYHLLRRLNMVRSALRRSDPATASVAEIALGYQFFAFRRFAVAYRTIFGETPSTTLQRSN
jgi:AraC-like DNA-binding protein